MLTIDAKLYIPTRYPNGLPGLIPAEVFTGDEASRAIASAWKIVRAMEAEIS